MTKTRPRVVFLGTPAAAVPSLQALHRSCDVVLVVTRPDRPQGRSRRPKPSAVKEAALELGLPVDEAARGRDLPELWPDSEIDVGVVTAFGGLIPEPVLSRPQRGFLNVHFSLLPRWRGASPVSSAIAAGDEETGVSIMQLEATLDTGPVVAATTLVIGDKDAGTLTRLLAGIGADLVVEAVLNPSDGVPQMDELATYAPPIGPGLRILDLDQPAPVTANKVRSLAPKPGAVINLDVGRLLVKRAKATIEPLPSREWEFDDERLRIGSGGRAVELLEVQPEGKKAMKGSDWVRGWRRPPNVV